jgi:hypothetical protein
MSPAPPHPVNAFGHECWIVETSKDGERWRYFGKAWTMPGEPLLLHAVPRYLRFRPVDVASWSEPIEGDPSMPVSLVHLEEATRAELWPDDRHVGLPMLLPGGEIGRLVRFDHPDAGRWSYVLEFTGSSV